MKRAVHINLVWRLQTRPAAQRSAPGTTDSTQASERGRRGPQNWKNSTCKADLGGPGGEDSGSWQLRTLPRGGRPPKDESLPPHIVPGPGGAHLAPWCGCAPSSRSDGSSQPNTSMALRALRGTGPARPGTSKVASPVAARRHQKGGSAKESGAGARGGRITEPAPPRPAPRSSPTPACAPRRTREAPARPKTPCGRSAALPVLSIVRQECGAPDPPTAALAVNKQVPPRVCQEHKRLRRKTCVDFVGQVVFLRRRLLGQFVRGLRPGLPRRGRP